MKDWMEELGKIRLHGGDRKERLDGGVRKDKTAWTR
jgi:hypothetical protein